MKFLKMLPLLSVLVLTVSRTSFALDLNKDDEYLMEQLKDWNNWDFDIFEVDDNVQEDSLGRLFDLILEKHDLYETFKINRDPLSKFLNGLVLGYQRYNASYHNYLHAIDVLLSVDFIISIPGIDNGFTPLAKLSILFAAIIHDNEHMGLTNDFHIKSDSERALIYNDLSVNENYHLYASFSLLRQEGCNFLSNLTPAEFQTLRAIVIYMVLYSDISRHSELLNLVENINDIQEKNHQHLLSLTLILHSADLSNAARPWNHYYKRRLMLMEEMYAQGDKERTLGLEVCPTCDRDISVPEVSIQFIDEYVKPTFAALGDLFKYLASEFDEDISIPQSWNENIEDNRQKLMDQMR